jgi:hypothetical protein
MTSPLRRKRQTTVRSTLPATIHNHCSPHTPCAGPALLGGAVLVVVGLLAGLASARSAAAAVGRSNTDISAVQAPSYSTGQSGGRLKWLPQRPESAQAETTVTAAQHTTPSALPRPLRTAQNQNPKSSANPFSDPFGDKKKTLTPAPAEKLDKDLLQQMPVEPKPQDLTPAANPDKPAAAEKPYVAPEGLAPAKIDSKQPLLEQEMVSRQHELKEGCPSPKDLKPIAELTTNIVPSEGELPQDCPLGNAVFQTRAFSPITYTWTASGLCHKPLYFEDVQLERYGHMAGPWVQPFASGAHFFLTVPILPYKMGLELPNECMYTLGYYRPGNCAPYLFDPIPLSVRGALFEAGAWVGGIYAFP